MTSAPLYQSPTLPGGSASPENAQCDIAAQRAAICEHACALREQAQRLSAQSNALLDEAEQLMRDYLRQLSPRARKTILSRSAFARMTARLETMPVIEQAKGIIMAQAHCDEPRAFDLLRQASQRRNVPVRVLAAQLVAQAAEPPPTAKLATVEPRPDTDGAWMAAIAIGLKRLGFFEESDSVLQELITLDQEKDFGAAETYLQENEPEDADRLKYLLSRRSAGLYVGSPAQARSSASSPTSGGDQSADDPHTSASFR